MVVQLILPEGKIGVSVRSILGIFLLFVILSPIIKVVNDKFSFSDVWEYELDENFLSQTEAKEYQLLQDALQSELTREYQGAKVSLNFDSKSKQVSYIFVDLSDFVINKTDEHINYYTAIKEFVKKQINISDERIVVYG